MPFLDTVEGCFGERNLYGVLKVEKTATESEIRRAYHKLSLRVHPDRVDSGDVGEATEKFQVPKLKGHKSGVAFCIDRFLSK